MLFAGTPMDLKVGVRKGRRGSGSLPFELFQQHEKGKKIRIFPVTGGFFQTEVDPFTSLNEVNPWSGTGGRAIKIAGAGAPQ